jgi:hypothetical protein
MKATTLDTPRVCDVRHPQNWAVYLTFSLVSKRPSRLRGGGGCPGLSPDLAALFPQRGLE